MPKNFKCHACEYTAAFSGNLDKHVRAVHKKLKITTAENVAQALPEKVT